MELRIYGKREKRYSGGQIIKELKYHAKECRIYLTGNRESLKDFKGERIMYTHTHVYGRGVGG